MGLFPHKNIAMSLSNTIAGPKGLPLLGNIKQIKGDSFHLVLENWAKQYGPCYKINLAGKHMLVISDASLVKDVLKKRPKYYRRFKEMESVFSELGSHGVFSHDGDDWKRQRKLITPAFNTKNIARTIPLIQSKVSQLITRLLNDQSGDIHDHFRRLTIDVTTSLVFAHDMNMLGDADSKLQQHLDKIFPAIHQRLKTPFPYWRYVQLPADKKLQESLTYVQNKAHHIVETIRHQGEEAPNSILKSMVHETDEEAGQLNNEELFGNIMTLLLAGQDTTSNMLTWGSYFLAAYPEWQARLYQEVKDVDIASYAELDKLPLLTAFIRETLRLKSTAPLMFMQTKQALTLGDMSLVQGQKLVLLTRYPGMTNKDFNPELWLQSSCPHQDTHFPFGYGARACPGEGLALVELKLTLAEVIKHFEITPDCDMSKVTEHFAFTMWPTNMKLKWNQRELR